ncbi:MAG: hypothetical protein ACKVP0_17640 [Pirellulaceae bacterium]
MADRFRGVEVLYREGTRVSHAWVDEISPEPDGVSAQVSLIPTRGLYNERPSSWRIYSAWDVFGFSADRWDAGYISLTIYFERGLVESVLGCCENITSRTYDEDRFDQIGVWIRKYRRKKLERQLTPELRLLWNERLIGTVTQHLLGEFPDIQGTFAPAELAADVKADLASYGANQLSDYGGDDDDNLELDLRLQGEWRIETGAGLRIRTSIPTIDFRLGTISWFYAGLMNENG